MLVVGLGPTGETAANLLQRYGLTVCCVERNGEGTSLPRAGSVDSSVLGCWRELVGGEELSSWITTGVPASFVGMDGRDFLELETTEAGGEPNLAFIYQPGISRLLRGKLADCGVILGQEVVEVAEGPDLVEATLDDGRVIRSRWLLACDGAGSAVRRSLGIGFSGDRDHEEWQVLDLDLGGEPMAEPAFRFRCSPERPGVTTVLAAGRYRIEWVGSESEEPNVLEDLGLIGATVERRASYRHGSAAASSWQVGRVYLLGDAAHVIRPFAGQGISQGVRDAMAVAWRLTLAARFGVEAPPGYEDERRPAVRRASQVSNLAGALVRQRSRFVAWVRDHVLRSILMPVLGGKLDSQVLLSPGLVREGFVSARFRRHAGERLALTSVDDPRFVLLGQLPDGSRCESRFVRLPKGTENTTEPPRNSAGIFLVRPDGVVFSGGEAGDVSLIIEDLELRLGERVKTS